jgi:hypothetical protein
MLFIAVGVTWPIIVLKAKEIMVASETPLERVLVSNISAGMIHDKGPHVALKLKLKIQVMTMNPHAAAALFVDPGGNTANIIVEIMNVIPLPTLPRISGQRRPNRSMKQIQRNCATRAITDDIAWYFSVSSPAIPI